MKLQSPNPTYIIISTDIWEQQMNRWIFCYFYSRISFSFSATNVCTINTICWGCERNSQVDNLKLLWTILFHFYLQQTNMHVIHTFVYTPESDYISTWHPRQSATFRRCQIASQHTSPFDPPVSPLLFR